MQSERKEFLLSDYKGGQCFRLSLEDRRLTLSILTAESKSMIHLTAAEIKRLISVLTVCSGGFAADSKAPAGVVFSHDNEELLITPYHRYLSFCLKFNQDHEGFWEFYSWVDFPWEELPALLDFQLGAVQSMALDSLERQEALLPVFGLCQHDSPLGLMQ